MEVPKEGEQALLLIVPQQQQSENCVDALEVLSVYESLVGEERIALKTKTRLLHISY